METFLADWGYLAIYVATTLEGEFAYLSSVVAASLGHLKMPWVMLAAFLGAMSRDMTIFLVSRRSGERILSRKPETLQKISKATDWIANRSPIFLAFHRFVYGLSTATVLALGLSKISVFRFTIICALASFTWTVGYGVLGYFAADQVLQNLTWLKKYFLHILFGVTFLIFLFIKLKN